MTRIFLPIPLFLAVLLSFGPLSAQMPDDNDINGFDLPLLFDEDDTALPAEEEEPMIERIVFRDDSLEQLLVFLERLTGRSIIRPEALPTPSFSFNSQRPMTREEAILVIESLLSLNGITVMPLGDFLLKVVPAAQTQQQGPELLLESALDMQPSGRVMSRLYHLDFMRIEEFLQRIQPILTPQIGNAIPFENANAVLLTETVNNLRRIERLLEEFDTPLDSRMETRFYQVNYADAGELAGRLNALRESALRREVSTQTLIETDVRTNQIIIVTDPRSFDIFEEFLERMDVETEPRTRNEVIPLRHANAEEMASLLSQLVSQQLGQAEAQRRTELNGRPEAPEPEPEAPEPEPTPEGETPPEPEPAPVAPELEERAQELIEEMDPEFSSLLTILPDERSNSLLISGTRGDLRLIEGLVAKLDVLLSQVRIEVVIAEVTLSEEVPRGINAFEFSYDSDGEGTVGIGGPGWRFDAGATRDRFTIEGVLDIAERKSNINLLSVPTIVTSHNREANIIVGEARPVITQTVQDTGVTGFRSQVTFRDIGIELTVTPLIGPDGVIQLEINQLVDNVLRDVEVGGNLQPVIGRKQANSFVSVADGEMVVLGGLQSDELQESENRVALLGSIPLLGELFRTRREEIQKRELLLFIRPTVLMDTHTAYADARRQIDRMSDPDRIRGFIRQEDLGEAQERWRDRPDDESLSPTRRGARVH